MCVARRAYSRSLNAEYLALADAKWIVARERVPVRMVRVPMDDQEAEGTVL